MARAGKPIGPETPRTSEMMMMAVHMALCDSDSTQRSCGMHTLTARKMAHEATKEPVAPRRLSIHGNAHEPAMSPAAAGVSESPS
eukprot:3844141-Pleurochrysis_carterae.AAC.3